MQCSFPISKCPALSCTPFEKSIKSSAIDYFKSHLLAQHSMNEGESATDLRVIFNQQHQNTKIIHKKICTTFTHVLAFKTPKGLKYKNSDDQYGPALGTALPQLLSFCFL